MLNFDHCVKIQNYWLTYCFQSCASLWRQISILKDSLDLQTRPEKIKKEGYESSDVDFDGLYPQYEASLRFFRWNTHQDMRCPAPRWDVFEFSLPMIIIMVCSWPSFSFMSKTHSGRNVQFTYENPKIGLEKIEKCFKFPKPRPIKNSFYCLDIEIHLRILELKKQKYLIKYLKFKLTKKLEFFDETMNRFVWKILRPDYVG